jgi:hypothetical protein
MLSPVHVAMSLMLSVLSMLTPVSRLGMWNLPLEQRLGNFGDVTSRIELRNAAGQLTAYVAVDKIENSHKNYSYRHILN